jgi:dihydrodipicolinate synthase/N-acetylneuraminate lyase
MSTPLPTTRVGWHTRLFPRGIPPLWCPLLTHYREDGSLDRARITAHLRHLAPHVKGFLIPGSTGDGWEMSEPEIRDLLGVVGPELERLELHLLVGVLKTDTADAVRFIRQTKAGPGVGFTVCPPRGADLAQPAMRDALASVLELGLPTALYQLPQVTQNEMSPDTVAELAARFPNFILFKDTSGADRVANSGRDLGGVFLVRGAEGGYATWLKSGGGPYDGFLLSTANCFGRELHQVIELLKSGRRDEAQRLSDRLSTVVKEVFALVTGLPDGNAFANANKAMDHFFAHGAKAASATPPRLHAGSRLPVEVIRQTGVVLERHGFTPERGYME